MPRQPLTEEQKQVLRDRLAKAREAKKLKAATEVRPIIDKAGSVADEINRASAKVIRKHMRKVASRQLTKEAVATVALAQPAYRIPTETEWNEMPLDRADTLLRLMCEAVRTASNIIQHRAKQDNILYCSECQKELPTRIDAGRSVYTWSSVVTRRDTTTGLYYNDYICSQNCYMRASTAGKFARAGIGPQGHVPQSKMPS